MSGPRIIFVAGVSGSGKSTAMAALEDLSFYCVDNLPVQLIEQFLHLCTKATPPIAAIALAIDTREVAFLRAVPGVLTQLRGGGAKVEVIFLDCTDEVLVNRYRETRRVHPHAPGGTVQAGIEIERGLLAELGALADHRIETSDLNVHELRAAIVRHVSGEARPTVVNVVSFGFRYGALSTAELLFDVRFLPNPYFEEALRDLTGLDREVSDYVLEKPEGGEVFRRLRELLDFLIPLYDGEGRAYLTVGVGCTGGRHRSVAIASALARALRESGREVNLEHRDVERSQ